MTPIDKKIIALRYPIWGVGHVQAFLQCGKTKAYNEIAKCRLRFPQSCGRTEVFRCKFLEMMGTDYEAEIKNAYIEKEAEQNAKREKPISLPR